MIASASKVGTGPNRSNGSECVGTRLLLLVLAASCLVSCRVSPTSTAPVDGPSTLRYLEGSWTQLQSGIGDGDQRTHVRVVYQLSPSAHRLLEERDAGWKYAGVILWNPVSCVFVRYALYETAMPGYVNASAWTGTLDVPRGMILWHGTNGLPVSAWHLRPPDEMEIREPDRSDPWNPSKGRSVTRCVRDGAIKAVRRKTTDVPSRHSAFREAIGSGRSFADIRTVYGDLMESYTNAEGCIVAQVLLGLDPEEPAVAATRTVGYSLVASNGVIILYSPIVWNVGATALRPQE